MQKIHSRTAQEIHIVTLAKKYQPLPKSWNRAAGMASNKKKSLEAHAKKVRKEWK